MPRCCHHPATVTPCAAIAKLPPPSVCCAAATATATASAPPPSCHQRCAVVLPSLLPFPCCCHRVATIAPCVAAKMPLPLCRRHAAAVGALSRCCHRHCRHRRCCRCRRCRAAVHWLVVALLSAVQFCHRMPSCNCQGCCCRLFLPIIVLHCYHHQHPKT